MKEGGWGVGGRDHQQAECRCALFHILYTEKHMPIKKVVVFFSNFFFFSIFFLSINHRVTVRQNEMKTEALFGDDFAIV